MKPRSNHFGVVRLAGVVAAIVAGLFSGSIKVTAQEAADSKPGRTGTGAPEGKPGYTKAISSEAGLAAVVGQLQQPTSRFQTFLELLDFAGSPQGNFQGDDPLLNQMRTEARQAMDECPDLEGVVATMIQWLDEPTHRLEMISALLKLPRPTEGYGSVVLLSGHPKLDPTLKKAAEAVSRAADVKTVAEALASPDLTLRRWGVGKFGNPLGRPEEWTPLLPQMEAIASGEGSDLRGAAIAPLAHFPGTEPFLAERAGREKSAFVLMGLLGDGTVVGDGTHRKFLARFVPLLSDHDETVRDEALDFIGCNSGWAEACQVPFGRDVVDPVIRSTKSRSAHERFLAVFALNYIRHLAPGASRKACLRLANDPDENVRWRLGYCLAGQYERDDVKRAVAGLVQDKSPMVSYMTILALGPTNYVPRLRELSRGANSQAAQWASEKLVQIGAAK